MADYPCDFHLAHYEGTSYRAFMNIYHDDQVAALRASVCGDCLAVIVQDWLQRALVKAQEGYWLRPDPDTTLEDAWRTRSAPPEPLRRRRTA